MNDYIKTYDNVLSAEGCKHIIDKFEDNRNQWQKTTFEKPNEGGHRSFTEININLHEDWQEYVNIIYKSLNPYLQKYADDHNINHNWPERYGWEQIRFKKYEVNDKDEFKEHVDVMDYASAKRFLVMFLYLNDNEGGLTEFPEYDTMIQPKAGTLLMFPPFWTHKHIGHKPIGKPKYIIGSYLHYT